MAYIDSVTFMKWNEDADGKIRPNALRDVYIWARGNNEQLPDGTFGKFSDLTGQANTNTRILDNLAIFAADLEITVPTAQQFAADPRFWTLGFWRYDDEGNVLDHNWDTTLDAAERQQAVNYITSNSNITAQQLGARFNVDDTRAEIAEKLKAFFRE